MSVQDLDDDELYEQLKNADLADKFLESPQGKLIKIAAEKIVNRAIDQFALNPEILKDMEKLIELRVIIKKYRYGLFEEIEMLRNDGFLAWQELKNRHPESSNQESLNPTEKGEQDGMA